MSSPAAYGLGDRVVFTRSLNRDHRDPGHWPQHANFRGTAKIWTTERWPGDTPTDEPRDGIVIGKRTLANGLICWGGYEDPDTFKPVEHFTAYLIAFSMRHNPVYVLPEHIHPADTTILPAAPAAETIDTQQELLW